MHRLSSAACRCGHPHDAHEHFHRGLACALCSGGRCTDFRSSQPPRLLLRLWQRPVDRVEVLAQTGPAPVPARPHLYLVR